MSSLPKKIISIPACDVRASAIQENSRLGLPPFRDKYGKFMVSQRSRNVEIGQGTLLYLVKTYSEI